MAMVRVRRITDAGAGCGGVNMEMTYTEALETILGRLPASDDVALRLIGVRLDGIERRQGEELDLLHQVNGRVQEHSTLLAKQCQWIKDHMKTHEGVDKELDSSRSRANITALIGVALVAVSEGILWVARR